MGEDDGKKLREGLDLMEERVSRITSEEKAAEDAKYKQSRNTFQDHRKSGKRTLKKIKEAKAPKRRSALSKLEMFFSSEHFEIFLDIVLNRNHGLFWRY